jgi:hypothetical protein
MKERGQLYAAPMVLKLLADLKDQTRRRMRVQPPPSTTGFSVYHHPDPRPHWYANDGGSLLDFAVPCPQGAPGDRLWVRETWMPDPPRDGTWPSTQYDGCKPRDLTLIPDRFKAPEYCLYRATWEGAPLRGWGPAIHMPRWAARILLEVTQVRVQRLQDISEADAIAEGIERYTGALRWVKYLDAISGEPVHNTARDAYFALWEALHGPGSVDANEWVWAINFKRLAT